MTESPEHKTNKQRLKEITDGIEQGIKDLFESDRYRQYLSVMSRFHRYNLNNTLLIYMQKPDASLVADYNKWKDNFGRYVKKGERGITIIAPTPFKKKVEEIKLDPDTKAPLLDKDGNAIMEEKEINIPVFKPVKVFDVSQTAGRPLPQLAASLSGNVEQYDVFVEALRRSAPVPITFQALAPNMDGFFSPKDQSITIREGMSEVQTISALVHEIAHSKLHNPKLTEEKEAWMIVMVSEGGTTKDYESGFETEADAEARAETAGWRYLDENEFEWRLEVAEDLEAVKTVEKNRRTEEVEAESVSYAVCQYYGIQTGENSFGYIAAWSKGKELKELKASLETINKTASDLISDINGNYMEICKERGIDPKAKAGQEQAAPDAYQLYAADLCDYLESLHQDGRIKEPFPIEEKEAAAVKLAEMFRHGGFDSAQRILNDAAEQSGILPNVMLDRLLKLSDQWDKGLTFRLEPNELHPGISFVTPYENTDNGLVPHDFLFTGPTEVCQKLLTELNEGTMTARQVRALNRQWEQAEGQMPPGEPEMLYLVDDTAYLHIQTTDAGFDYTLYDAATMQEIDGGQFGVESIEPHPAPTQMDAAYRESKFNGAKIGKLLCRGGYSFIVSDPVAQIQHIIRTHAVDGDRTLEVNGLIPANMIYSAYWNHADPATEQVVLMRSPLVDASEVTVCGLAKTPEMFRWYSHIKSGLILSIHDVNTLALQNCDFDGDRCFSSNNTILIKGAQKNPVPILYPSAGTQLKGTITSESMIEADIRGLNSAVGSLSNQATCLYALREKYEKDSPEYEELSRRIKIVSELVGVEIDKIKTGIPPMKPSAWNRERIPYEQVEGHAEDGAAKKVPACSPEEQERSRKHNALIPDGKPVFMRYIYETLDRDLVQ